MSVTKHQGMNLFDIAIRICAAGNKIVPAEWIVDILCDPWANNMIIWVNCMGSGNTYISIDYMKWIKSRLEKTAGRGKPPCFISPEGKQWLTRIDEIARSYGGMKHWESRTEDVPFTYEGPYYLKCELRYHVKEAAEQAGLAYADWKRFWRRNSMKIKQHMEPYFDNITVDFPCWRW